MSPATVSIHPAPRPTRRLSAKLIAALVLWVGAALLGTGSLLAYQQRAGAPAVAPKAWPSDTGVPRDETLPTLVMVVHPKCSCSRASIGELSKLMTQLSGKMVTRVLFVLPAHVAQDWANTDLYRSASAITGVDVRIDVGGAEAKRFGALTSGQSYLYSPAGTLMFSGGITASRGHHGDNLGSKSIVSIVTGASSGRADQPATNVYGCEIPDPPGSETTN
ncbi:MAG TPA: hypothetical protein VM925_12330 [Labilithrix sp.]|nr:hypothetical protein [Labilithrix sp.]